jgi:hypothetical protein
MTGRWVFSAKVSAEALANQPDHILFFNNCIWSRIAESTPSNLEKFNIMYWYILYTNHFGSHWTYPLLTPFTSLTTNSKASKSSAVTASNATSNNIKAHSKKAYVVYAGF